MSKFKFGNKVRVLKPHWHDESEIGVITSSENGLNTVHFNGGQFSCLIPDDYLTLVSAWIPCSERMPEDALDVLVSNGNYIKMVLLNYVGGNDGCFWISTAGDFTHWMPLPTPPQE